MDGSNHICLHPACQPNQKKKKTKLAGLLARRIFFSFCWARDMATRSPYTDLLTFSFITDSILLELFFLFT
jgi:hypothetical protein